MPDLPRKVVVAVLSTHPDDRRAAWILDLPVASVRRLREILLG